MKAGCTVESVLTDWGLNRKPMLLCRRSLQVHQSASRRSGGRALTTHRTITGAYVECEYVDGKLTYQKIKKNQ